MLTCEGCKWRIQTVGGDVCTVPKGAGQYVWNDFTGMYVWRDNRDGVEPLTSVVRAKDGRCGPEARLYEQGWLTKLFNRLFHLQEHKHARQL